MKKCLCLIVLCCFFTPIPGGAGQPYDVQAVSGPTPIAEAFQQLAGTISSFYAILFTPASNANRPSQNSSLALTVADTASAQSHSEEDGYILSLDGRQAHASLGKNDGIRRGMLLEIYRPKMLYDAVSDQRYALKESLGLGLVIDVFEETSVLYLSKFEVKTVVSKDGQAISSPVVEVSDRVKIPVSTPSQGTGAVQQLRLGKATPPTDAKLPEYARVVAVDPRKVYLDFSGAAVVDDELTLIKEAKTMTHPVTGELLVIGEEKRATGRVSEIQETSTGILLPADTSNTFIVGDKVKIVKNQ